jgi:hypothetical protein
MGELKTLITQQAGQSTELVPHTEDALSDKRLGKDGFDFADVMKRRMGILGRVQVSFEERRIAREEVKQVLSNQMRAQTQLMLSRAKLDLEYLKEVDQAAHNVRVQRIEKFLLHEEARLQHDLNGMIDKFEDEYTTQYTDVRNKLNAELAAGKIDQDIFDMRMNRASKRYLESMDKSAQDMQMIVENHRGNLASTLKNDI